MCAMSYCGQPGHMAEQPGMPTFEKGLLSTLILWLILRLLLLASIILSSLLIAETAHEKSTWV